MLAMALDIVAAPIVRVARRIDADMGDAELRPDPIIVVVARRDLGPDMHKGSYRRASAGGKAKRRGGHRSAGLGTAAPGCT